MTDDHVDEPTQNIPADPTDESVEAAPTDPADGTRVSPDIGADSTLDGGAPTAPTAADGAVAAGLASTATTSAFASPDEPHTADVAPVVVEERTAVEQLARRTNMLVGILAVLLVGAFVVIGLLFGRVADAEAEAEAARTELAALGASGGASSEELDEIRAELERVEAGAALYASQVTGFQEQLVALEPQVSAGVEEAITGLRDFGDSTITFDVNIDEVVPIQTEVVIDRVIEVPIKTTIPINETIDTTIDVSTPIGDIPIDVSVPVDVDVPIDLVVEIPINETVEIDEEFPVQLDVPIAIEVRETELANLTDSLATGLESLKDVLTGFG